MPFSNGVVVLVVNRMVLTELLQQFSALANREIEGMDNLIRSFASIVEDFKRKPYGAVGT